MDFHSQADPRHGVSGGAITVTGQDALARHLNGFASKLDDIPDVFATIAGRAAGVARSLAPRRTGELASSIRPENTPNRASVVATSDHAGFVNYGVPSRHIAPQHFMQRVDPIITPEATTAIDRALTGLIHREGL